MTPTRESTSRCGPGTAKEKEVSDEIQRDLGRHEAQIEQLREDMSSVKADVHTIKEILSEAKGGWKTLLLVAGVAGSAGAIISKLSSIFPLFSR